jgi:hypothetical protein
VQWVCRYSKEKAPGSRELRVKSFRNPTLFFPLAAQIQRPPKDHRQAINQSINHNQGMTRNERAAFARYFILLPV